MRILLRYAFILLVWGYGAAANAQTTTLVLSDMQRVNGMTWKYGTVTCSSTNGITSITISMTNNNLSGSNTSGINPTQTLNSLSENPRTITYLFNAAPYASGITGTQAENFIKGITFLQTNDNPSFFPSVNITVDANPTRLPAGATITEWRGHPDGDIHYYVWVAKGSSPAANFYYEAAYNAAKSYYFQGRRGYMPTITSAAENSLLTQISNQEGWSGGARTTDVVDDRMIITRPTRDNDTSKNGRNYRWLCGPETGFYYTYGPTYTQGSAMNGAFNSWNTNEPNDSQSAENVMQVNYSTNLKWNDYSPTNTAIKGYFIEFGGNGSAYSVGGANYNANPDYYTPSTLTTNNQWEGYSPGNTAKTTTTFKPNVMRSNVLVIE